MPGNVNRVDSFGVVGWAATEDRSAGDVIEISVDGEPCATVLASQSRPALRERGIADGKCGFRYDFDKPIAVTRPATVEIRSAKTRRPLGGVPRTVEPWLTTGDGYRLNLQQRFHAVLLNDAIRRDDELRVRALVFAPRDARLRVIPVNSVPGVSIAGTTVTLAEYDGYDFNADAGDDAQCHLLSFSVHGFRTHPDDVLHLVVADDNASARQLGTMGICIPLRTDWVTLPTEENWVRTSGRELTARGFIDTGVNSASRICSIAREYMALDGPITVLDWGVGCGRIAIPLKRRFVPARRKCRWPGRRRIQYQVVP